MKCMGALSIGLVVVLASISVVAQSGATFYVSTTGNDSNSGSFTAPWRTVQHAANSVTAGATVYVEGGVYNESVRFPASGTSANPITFTNYPGQNAVIDGTGLAVSGTQGLINIANQSYVTVNGFEIRNYTTGNASVTPAGIWVTGSGSGVKLLHNKVHNITTKVEAIGNAFGIAVYGTSTTPITNLTISGNQVYSLKTGSSESVNVDGNVTHFSITNNLIHDNDNIGIDTIGFEPNVGPNGFNQAKYGVISGNTIYNISSYSNPAYQHSYSADGIYCDGCAYVIIERNDVHNCDLNMEAASEHQGHNASYVTIRNNLFYNANTVGVSIGGYARSGNGGGGSDHIVVVNNTLYNNNTKTQGAEFQIQYHSSSSTNLFENNIVYAGIQNSWIYSNVSGSTATNNWNLYYSKAGYSQGTSITWGGNSGYTSYANYQTKTGEDKSSPNANPEFVNLTSNPPNLDVTSTSPAIDAGSTALTCNVGYCGSGTSIYGSTDYAGNPRINSSGQINVGAYTGQVHAFLATPSHGEADSESVAPAARGETTESPKIAVPENVRKQLEPQLRLGRFGPMVMTRAAQGPTPSGQLSISGTLQDGSTLTAGGVTWTPAPCSNGACSMGVMSVSYAWQACRRATCTNTALPTTQPYLATLLLQVGDVGARIKVTETATDLRSNGAYQRARVSFEAARTVAGWSQGTAPRVDFVDGLPESTTASNQEAFFLSPAHANPADGSVVVSCAVDGRSTLCTHATPGRPGWLETKTLAVGSHRVDVQATNRAGTSTTSFTWSVVPHLLPQPCTSCFKPPHLDNTGKPMTWDWQLTSSNSAACQIPIVQNPPCPLTFHPVDMFDIDGTVNTASDVAKIHSSPGRTLAHEKAICYLSLGSWEDYRPDALSWPGPTLGLVLTGFADEHWVDVRQLSSLQPIIDARLSMCATKGFDGVEVDNIDGWNGALDGTSPKGFPLTKSDAEAWLAYIANQAHSLNMFVIWKNNDEDTSFGARYFDGAISEQCYSFAQCTPQQEVNNGAPGCDLNQNPCGVQVFADAHKWFPGQVDKWVGEVEYDDQLPSGFSFSAFCRQTWQLEPAGFGLSAWLANSALDASTFRPCWPSKPAR
jgi:endo-alpha-1,4-polygalactosaminidase (GH114 family)